MSRGPGAWVSPLVALLVFAASAAQTFGALRVTGAFGWRAPARRVPMAPAYHALERALDRHDPGFRLAGLRDPFAYGRGESRTGTAPPPTRTRPVPVVVAAVPVLTAIVWDNDPRALVHWKDRDWTVREGGLFDEFQVTGITRDQIVLRRGDETLVLRRRNPGE